MKIERQPLSWEMDSLVVWVETDEDILLLELLALHLEVHHRLKKGDILHIPVLKDAVVKGKA